MPWLRRSPNALLAIAVLAIVTTGGAVYGWSSLELLLEAEGEFAELCTKEGKPEGCAAQKVAYDQVFTVSTSTTVMLFFTSGALLDMIGPRLLCMLGASVYALGCFLIAISQSRGPNLYILGYSLLSWGGPALFLSFIPLSSLYGRWSNTVICTINSAFDATPYLFTLFQLIASETGTTHTTLFALYSLIPLLIAITSPMLWADSAADYKMRSDENSADTLLEVSASEGESGTALSEGWTMLWQRVKGMICSADYAWLLAIFASGLVRINFFLGSLKLQLVHDSAVWVDVFSVSVVVGAVVAIPLGGRLLRQGRVTASVGLLSVWLLFNILSLIPHVVAQVGSFMVLALFRPFFYSCASSFMAETFGFKYFGILYGFATLIGAAFSFLQWPIVSYTEHSLDGSFLIINSVFLVLQLPLMFYPFYLMRKSARAPALLANSHTLVPTEDPDKY